MTTLHREGTPIRHLGSRLASLWVEPWESSSRGHTYSPPGFTLGISVGRTLGIFIERCGTPICHLGSRLASLWVEPWKSSSRGHTYPPPGFTLGNLHREGTPIRHLGSRLASLWVEPWESSSRGHTYPPPGFTLGISMGRTLGIFIERAHLSATWVHAWHLCGSSLGNLHREGTPIRHLGTRLASLWVEPWKSSSRGHTYSLPGYTLGISVGRALGIFIITQKSKFIFVT